MATKRTLFIALENLVSGRGYSLLDIHILSFIMHFKPHHNNTHNILKNIKTDACSAQWNDLKIAMKAKSMSDTKEAQRLIAETHYKKNLGSDLTNSPTAGVIWDLKETPGWDEV